MREQLQRQMQQQLRQQRSILAPDAVTQKQRELERRYAELRRKAEQAAAGSVLARLTGE